MIGTTMSAEEFSRGIELIEATARRFGLSPGSRHVDSSRHVDFLRQEAFSRGSVRLSLEKTVDLGGQPRLRTPAMEVSRQFVEDLPATGNYKDGLEKYLESLSLRILHPKPFQFLTLSGVPFEAEIRWPFRPVQDSPDLFVHVFVRVGSPWSHEAGFTVLLFDPDWVQMGPSHSPPMIESYVINSVREFIDRKDAKFYPVGEHPEVLQRVRMDPLKLRRNTTPAADPEVEDFLKRKIYWLGFREGDKKTLVSIDDPYDASYLRLPSQRLKQIAQILSANAAVGLDRSGHYAYAKDGLLSQAATFETELTELLKTRKAAQPRETMGVLKDDPSRSVFISYSSDDAPFARALANSLRGRNIGIWLDEEEIRVGASLVGRIGQGLNDNDFFVVILSPSSVRSEWVNRELREALAREIGEKRVVVLPVIARTCKVPPFLTDKKYADFTTNSDQALDALVGAIQQHQLSSRP
jgi:hypothetical protein